MWDDHEIANNGYRDSFSGMNNTEDSFEELGMVSVDQRKMKYASLNAFLSCTAY